MEWMLLKKPRHPYLTHDIYLEQMLIDLKLVPYCNNVTQHSERELINELDRV